MTENILYTFLMQNISFLLLSNTYILALRGGFFLVLLFSFCFLCVHLITYLASKQKNTPPPPEQEPEKEKAPAVSQPEPVYYIVERKKKRAKTQYGEPKEIRFK
jgi:hypothetical protein